MRTIARLYRAFDVFMDRRPILNWGLVLAYGFLVLSGLFNIAHATGASAGVFLTLSGIGVSLVILTILHMISSIMYLRLGPNANVIYRKMKAYRRALKDCRVYDL